MVLTDIKNLASLQVLCLASHCCLLVLQVLLRQNLSRLLVLLFERAVSASILTILTSGSLTRSTTLQRLNFEDLVGYPSIADLQKNPPEVKYVPTKSSIWGKDLIAFDEINRCSEDRQSNLFEIIRSRKLHGLPTGNTFIMSTMNPLGIKVL